MTCFTGYIAQAYIQSKPRLELNLYTRAPSEMGLPKYFVFEILKPLYIVPESGLNWYQTYLAHNLEDLGMKRSRADPFMMYRRGGEGLEGLIVLQVDDSFGIGTE